MTIVYLAGGMKSQWQDKVIAACPAPRFSFLDPRSHGLSDEKAYTKWDLDAMLAASPEKESALPVGEASPADGDCDAGERCSCACHVRTDMRADGSEGKGTGRHIACFVLEPTDELGVKASDDWTDDAACLSGLADRLEQESADESERGNDSAAAAWSCRAYELRQIVSRMVRASGVEACGNTPYDEGPFTIAHPPTVERLMELVRTLPPRSMRPERNAYLAEIEAIAATLRDGVQEAPRG